MGQANLESFNGKIRDELAVECEDCRHATASTGISGAMAKLLDSSGTTQRIELLTIDAGRDSTIGLT